jgi:hypothetical protein
MNRRTFLQTTGGLGLSAAMPWGASLAREKSTEFLKTKTSDGMLFPCPRDGAQSDISPAGLAWLPCPSAAGYRVDIFDAEGSRIYSKGVGADPVHCPDRVLPPGAYTWDVVALDRDGKNIARRGKHSFTIRRGAIELPWIEPKELLRRVPREHPRILYPKARLEGLRATLSTSRKDAWRDLQGRAQKARSRGVPQFPTYHRLQDPVVQRLEYQKYFGYFRGYVNGALMDLALAYLMTQEARYAEAAKKILLEIAAWPTADDDVTSVSAKWGDEAGLSFSKCVHLAYDWLCDALDERERAVVFKMCRDRAGQTYRRLKRSNYLTNPGESHNGRLIAYLTDMSLALAGEAEEAETWLTYSLKALLTIYPHWAGADGGWAEGTAYGLWYNTFYIPAFEGLRQLAGYDLWQRPFFKNVRSFFFYCTANHGEIRPFGDGAEGGGPGVQGGSGYADFMAFHAHRYQDPHIGWWVKQIPGNTSRGEPFLSLLHEDELPARAPTDLPHSRVFRSVGWAGLHSNLADPKNDTCLIFKSSPYGSVSHSHADQNAFAIMKGGAALAIPSGYYGPSYGRPHHAEWTRATKANNCILVDGQGQTIRSAAASGSIVDFKEAPGYSYVAGDATAAYGDKLKKWVRRILFLRPGLFLLVDEIATPEPVRCQWLLHAFEEMEIEDARITSRRKDATLGVHLACPQGLKLSQTDRFDTPYNHGIPEAYHKDKANHWHVTAETVEKSAAIRIGAVMAAHGKGERLEVRVRRQDGWFGAAASGDFGEVEGWIRLDEVESLPAGFAGKVPGQTVNLCGRSREGEIFGA